jgi:HlyD family secretion protein
MIAGMTRLKRTTILRRRFRFAVKSLRIFEVQLDRLKIQLESNRLSLKAEFASLQSDLSQARIEADTDEALRKEQLVADLVARRSRARADELHVRSDIERERLVNAAKLAQAELTAGVVELENIRKQHHLRIRQVEALKVRAGMTGVLQRLGDDRPLQVGQQIVAGANIARIADPSSLKAVLRIPEIHAKDILLDQTVQIDTRNGIVPGRVARIDPAVQNGTVTVDIQLNGPLPRGARPDLSVAGTITIETLDNVLYIGRPVNGGAESVATLFTVIEGGRIALRTPVVLGRSSISSVEIVAGLNVGDQVILSDMSPWDGHDKIKLR